MNTDYWLVEATKPTKLEKVKKILENNIQEKLIH